MDILTLNRASKRPKARKGSPFSINRAGTGNISPNAVTQAASAYTAGYSASTIANSAVTTIQTLTVTGIGGVMSLAASTDFEIQNNSATVYAGTITGYVYRGATLVASMTIPVYMPVNTAGYVVHSSIAMPGLSDSPGAGTFTYTLQVKQDSNTFLVSPRNTLLTCTELKR